MVRVYKLPGKDFGFEGDRVYKVVERIPHRVFAGFGQFQNQDKWGEAMDFLLVECITEGPIPDGKDENGNTKWKMGRLTPEYLASDDCDGVEMNLLTEMLLEDYPVFDPKKQNELKKKARKSSG